MRFALDTDSLSFAARCEGRVLDRIREAGPDDVAVAAIVAFEVRRGIGFGRLGTRRRRQIESLMERFGVIAFDDLCASHAADIWVALARDGALIGPIDTLIAGAARANGLVLVTHNQREFSRVPGLVIEDWY